jgi:hypothetical protein
MTIVRRSVLGLLVAAAIVTMGFSIHAGGWNVVSILFGLWGAAPYGAFALVNIRPVKSRLALACAALGGVAAIVFGMTGFVKALYLYPDPQSPLRFIFIPLYQWGGWLVVAILVVSSSLPLKRST